MPPRYQEELTASVGALVASLDCPPPAAAPDVTGSDDAADEDEDGAEDEDDEGKQKGKKKGKRGGKG